jgi:hypothetical protein
MWGLGNKWSVWIEWEGFGPVGEEEKGASAYPANPKNIEAEVEPLL